MKVKLSVKKICDSCKVIPSPLPRHGHLREPAAMGSARLSLPAPGCPETWTAPFQHSIPRHLHRGSATPVLGGRGHPARWGRGDAPPGAHRERPWHAFSVSTCSREAMSRTHPASGTGRTRADETSEGDGRQP